MSFMERIHKELFGFAKNKTVLGVSSSLVAFLQFDPQRIRSHIIPYPHIGEHIFSATEMCASDAGIIWLGPV